MVKLNRIYTRTGDDGRAGLVDGSRVSKAGLRMTAIGEIDEANSALGVAISALGGNDDLQRIQNDLFDLGADIATPMGGELDATALRIVGEQVDRLEAEIDTLNAELEPLKSFILPGGSPGIAHLYYARAVVRRAERAVVALMVEETVNPHALAYLNRLSDLLFVAARHTAASEDGDILWSPGANR